MASFSQESLFSRLYLGPLQITPATRYHRVKVSSFYLWALTTSQDRKYNVNPFYKEQVPNYASDSIHPSFGKLTFRAVIPELGEHGLGPGSTFYGNPFKKTPFR